jgi:arginine decarboxylase
MRGNPKDYEGDATIFATHSTHKLLNALSQASFIHIRKGNNPISENKFNQSYMMHESTSPLYAMAVSNDIAAAMMDGDTGTSLMKEAVYEAIYLRKEVARLHREYREKGSWFFSPWNPEIVTDPASGKKYPFEDAPMDLLAYTQSCWTLEPNDKWHGFGDIAPDWAMLDPIKVSILSPGMGEDGNLLDTGVPAHLVAYYFSKYGVVPTRVTDFQIMFLVSMGVTEGKSSTLIDLLVSFKSFYDKNTPLKEVLPELVAIDKARYGNLGLKDLGDEMFQYLKTHTPDKFLNAAYSSLPKIDISPRAAFNKIVKNEVELVPADKLVGRTAANSVMPYPPGFPMLMSGENFGEEDSPYIRYLKEMTLWDKTFPGFEKVTEGAEVIDGIYHVLCVKK